MAIRIIKIALVTLFAVIRLAIAEQGFLVIIPPMPFNLAVFNADAAAEIMNNHQEITHWAVGGHSLGGTMAASFAGSQPEMVDSLILWASYPADNNDLSSLTEKSIVSMAIGIIVHVGKQEERFRDAANLANGAFRSMFGIRPKRGHFECRQQIHCSLCHFQRPFIAVTEYCSPLTLPTLDLHFR